MKISAILSFFCLFVAAAAILPSASGLQEDNKPNNARRRASIAAKKTSRPDDVRALREQFKATAAAMTNPEDGVVVDATPSHHHGRSLDIFSDLLGLIFGGGDDGTEEENPDEGGDDLVVVLIGVLFDVLIPALSGGGEGEGGTDNLILNLLEAILPVIFGDNPLVMPVLDLVLGLLGGDEEMTDENRDILASQLKTLQSGLAR